MKKRKEIIVGCPFCGEHHLGDCRVDDYPPITKSFLILRETSSRNSDIIFLSVLGVFSSSEEADEAIIKKAGEFYQSEDGGGTRFLRLEEGDFVEKDGAYYVRPESINNPYPTPVEVRDRLEPY